MSKDNFKDDLNNRISGCDPSNEFPCVLITQRLLYDIFQSVIDKRSPLSLFAEHIFIELEIEKTFNIVTELRFYEKIAFDIDVFLITYENRIRIEHINDLKKCSELMNRMAVGQVNDEIYQEGDGEFAMLTNSSNYKNFDLTIYNKYYNPTIFCPGCTNRFSQIKLGVVRTPYTVRCPHCSQVIAR